MEERAILLLLLAAGAIGGVYFLIIGIRAILQLLAVIIRIIILVLLIVLGGMYLAKWVDKYTKEPDLQLEQPDEESALAREEENGLYKERPGWLAGQ